ncbi:MAG TPA: AlkA N-terminal domain-containing protein [Polyangiaceae bacterium]|nr:AlkA N-terminal domain-containing protein [Polyangiaceae bacterium]
MSEKREPASRRVATVRFGAVMLDPRASYEALQTRDERFDGRLFVGVISTGVYCRPVCPARPAKFENCRFYPSAAAAQAAGFRPCLRCRPETAPEAGSWRGTFNTVSRGLALIADGHLDGSEDRVHRLAERLGIGERQLRRLFQQHLGATPVAVAQTRRVLLATQLIRETRLPMAEIAHASGFRSVRRFNETFQQVFHRSPGALRRRSGSSLPEESISRQGVTVRLRYRPPYDWAAMLAHLSARAIEGVERVEGAAYFRTALHGDHIGVVEVTHDSSRASLVATIRIPCVRALPGIVARIRRAFDLGADVTAIGSHLAGDPLLAPLVARRPGLRVPGGWDGFEFAVRAVLGQQVSVPVARMLAGRLARLCGAPLVGAEAAHRALRRAFPTPTQLARADLAALAIPEARRRSLLGLARATQDDPTLFQPLGTIDQTVAKLRAIPGIGEWTAQLIALRVAREPDAFPASDRALLRVAALRIGAAVDSVQLLERAQRWRPWRAYAAQHLWAFDAELRSPSIAEGPS